MGDVLARFANLLIRLIATDRRGDESFAFAIKDEFETADMTPVQARRAWRIFRVAVTNLRTAGRTPPKHRGQRAYACPISGASNFLVSRPSQRASADVGRRGQPVGRHR